MENRQGLRDKIAAHGFPSILSNSADMLAGGSAALAVAHAGDCRRALRRWRALDRGLCQFGCQVGADIRCEPAPVLACSR